MLSDLVLEKVFANNQTKQVPIGYQYMMLEVFMEVLEEIKGELGNVTIDELSE